MMNATIRRKGKEDATFSAQVRFNWGYHDAAQTVKQGWNCATHFWGFAKALGEQMTGPDDITAVHFDKTYAKGWLAGYRDAEQGRYTGNSQAAWDLRNEFSRS